VTSAALATAIACTSGGESSAPKKSASAADIARGRELYKANCTSCHGDNGKGDGPAAVAFKPKPRDHTDAAYMNTLTDQQIATTIQMGGAPQGKPLMPSHPQIRGADMDALVAFVRSLSRGTQ
jgi:cytochrome c oxidase cbb3-type subunit 2